MTTTMKLKRILALSLVAGLAAMVPALARPRPAVAAQEQSEAQGKPAKPAKPDKQAKQQEKLAKQQAKEQERQQKQLAKQQKEAKPAASQPTYNASQQSAAKPENLKKQKPSPTGSDASTTTTARATAPATTGARPQVTTTTPPQGVKPPKNVHYQIRTQNTTTIRQHYQTQLSSIDPATRPVIVQNTYIVQDYVTYIQPCPVEVVELIAPPPPGFVVGFWDGYILVYDPGTFFVVAVLDLL